MKQINLRRSGVRFLYFKTLVLVFSLCSLIFVSCKKTGIEDQLSEKETLENFKKKNLDLGVSSWLPINQHFNYSFYTTKDGTQRMVGDSNSTMHRGFTACSEAYCADPFTQDYQTEQQLKFMGRMYSCSRGTSDISFSWEISLPNTLVSQNPLNALQKSVGKIYMRTSSNVNIVSALLLIPEIIPMGIDPNCANHKIFKVNYVYKDIPQNLFTNNPGYKIVTQFVSYLECYDYITSYISPTYTYTSTTSYNNIDFDPVTGHIYTACERTDRCYTNGGGGSFATVAGGYSLCSFTPANPTNYHRYEYRLKNSLSSNAWSAQTSTVKWAQDYSTGVPTHDLTPYGILKMTDMISGSGTWIVRYQNYMTSPCSPTAPWIEEVYTF